jgi:carbonic anhydrase
MPDRVATSPEHALELLMEGNRRWVEGRLAHPNRSAERRSELADGQAPFATVFSCIDSRVPAEIVFDCGLGDLAVVRTGAHVVDETSVMPSLRFAADLLGTPLVLVLGHQACGAVTAALDALASGQADPAFEPLIEALRPAYEEAGSADVEAMVRAHTQLTVQRLTASLPDRQVTGAYYSLDTGAVSILD